jgi:hypothetical protein
MSRSAVVALLDPLGEFDLFPAEQDSGSPGSGRAEAVESPAAQRDPRRACGVDESENSVLAASSVIVVALGLSAS